MKISMNSNEQKKRKNKKRGRLNLERGRRRRKGAQAITHLFSAELPDQLVLVTELFHDEDSRERGC